MLRHGRGATRRGQTTVFASRRGPTSDRLEDPGCDDEAVTSDLDPALVPELLVSDVDRSIEFWCSVCGFEVRYSRPEERFAYIALGTAHVMLEQVGVGRNWVAAQLEAPFGRGINLQITVPDADRIADALAGAGVELFMQLESKWYLTGDEEAGVQQFVVSDPDGYLIRFQSPLGRRATVR
ncbi:bleomycin resistance protein [Mycetocola sp. CAN_C7]|uniref:bleomycin resistance protein n=1 Tax=Mycetocola sp. CAN_C7 TaxID=2787724 RepID=UPI003FA5D363